MILPAIDQYLSLAHDGILVPVMKEVPSDLETPVSAYLKLTGGGKEPGFLLESVEGGEHVGRYSVIGVDPPLIVNLPLSEEASPHLSPNPLDLLTEKLRSYRVASVAGLPPFYGGAVGFFAYDLARYFEKLPYGTARASDFPVAAFFLAQKLVIFDRVSQKMLVITLADGEKGEQGYLEALRVIEEIENLLSLPLPGRGKPHLPGAERNGLEGHGAGEQAREIASWCAGGPESGTVGAGGEWTVLRTSMGRREFCEKVKIAKEYIRAGEIFQVVLSRRVEGKTGAAPFNIYRALRILNPSPYMFFLNFGPFCLIGSSPEVLVKARGESVETRPIAGTRGRGKTPEEDAYLTKELLADPKERAEHVMLVDLGRNDLGRVCRYGSVRVTSFMEVERYSHVTHLVSVVKGSLRPGMGHGDLLKAAFPAGTVSGAPKVRAMEIIQELEPVARGPYAGCVAYFSFSGNMDSCIAIRTIVMKGDSFFLQSGAGIVADSQPEREYEETVEKMEALCRAIEMAEGGLS